MLDTDLAGTISLTAVFFPLATLSIVLRFLARYRQQVKIWFDDYSILAAYIGFIGLIASFIYGMSQHIYGYHDPALAAEEKQLPAVKQISLAVDAMEVWTYGFIKLSALFFYRRLFCTCVRKDIFNYVTAVFICIVVAWTSTFFVMTFLLCGRHSIAWSIKGNNIAKCTLVYPYFEAVAISDFVLDVIILGMIFPRIWSTFGLSFKYKVAISCVFILAIGGVGASLARMIIYIHIVLTGRPVNDEDTYQVNTQMVYFAMLEAALGLVSVNLPTIWSFTKETKVQNFLHHIGRLVSPHFIGNVRGDSSTSITHDNDQAHTGVEKRIEVVSELQLSWSREYPADDIEST